MRRFAAIAALSIAALTVAASIAEAQTQLRRRGEEVLILNVRPRSFLDPGKVVPVGSLNRYATNGVLSYMVSPPWQHQRERFGEGTLPDPIHGPFVGARNPFGPIDYVAPPGLAR